MFKRNKEIVIILISFILRLFASCLVEPGIDEAYYGYLGRNPAWGFFDHPPAVSLLAGCGEQIFGIISPFTLRFGTILLFIITSWFFYDLCKSIFGKKTAITALILMNLIPFFSLGMGCFVFPDNVLGFGWVFFLWSINKVRISGNDKWFIISGIAAGISFLAKYHAIFLIGSMGLLLILYPNWRKYWRSIWLYIGLATAFLIFLPNIIWNFRNDWISYAYQFGKSKGEIQLSITHLGQFFAGQLVFLLPWNLILIFDSLLINLHKTIKKTNWLFPFIFLPYLTFLYFGLTRTVLPHWSMPSFIAALPLLAEHIEKWKAKTRHRYLWFSCIFLIVVIFIYIIQTTTGFIPLLRKIDPTLDGEGWDEVIFELKRDCFDKDRIFLFTRRYYTGGELAYAAGGDFLCTVLYKDPHIFAYTVDPDDLVGKDAIMVTQHDRYPRNPESLYMEYFRKIEHYKDVNTFRINGKIAQKYRLYYCTEFLKPYRNEY